MSIRRHALKMARHAFKWRYQKHLKSIKERGRLKTKKAKDEFALAPYDKESIKKLIRSVKHLDPRKVRLTKRSPGMKGTSINFVGKGWASDKGATMQIPLINAKESRALRKHISEKVKTFLKKSPDIRKLTKKARKRKYGFEAGGEVVICRNVDRSLL